eukprot:CAMPEP_0177660646 /NCGR_PEP_ID=MMETSP0447-20121125/18165_1 /TAXON_ID=0 /ORGANISM="Stygamoeba regulata, Strain BSH-02190019" /LENGTH=305 /DNA_ID=CAMNT_0019165753 /DNA_START=417 /DNA_END=1334 /DNA_ORIENTATION=-
MSQREKAEGLINSTKAGMGGFDEQVDKDKATAAAQSQEGLKDVDFVGELKSLDLSKLIGGPLSAAIHGLNIASNNTLKFLQTVCFEDDNKPRMIDFTLERPGGLVNMTPSKNVISIPFITMVPIPHLRLSKVRIEFSVKLTSVRTTNIGSTDNATIISSQSATHTQEKTKRSTTWSLSDQNQWSTTKKTADGDDESGKGGGPTDTLEESASLIGITTVKRENKVGATISKEYSLNIVVSAVQDELPRGIEKLLDILENEIQIGPEDNALQQQILQSALAAGGGTNPAAAGGASGGAGATGGAGGV